MATPLLAPDGSLIAAISAAVDASEADRLDAIGEQLKKTVDTLGPKWPQTALSRLDTVVWPRQSRPCCASCHRIRSTVMGSGNASAAGRPGDLEGSADRQCGCGIFRRWVGMR